MWEALDKAAYYRLDNLTAIVDVNRLGQRGPTELGWDLDAYTKRIEAFGCRAIPIDGHDLGQIDKALASVGGAGQPTVILARTLKGKGFSEVEDREGWHGRPLPAEMAERAITELGGERDLVVSGLPPEAGSPRVWPSGEVQPAPLRAGCQGRHPAGLRPGARRGRRPRRRRRPRRGGGQLHPRRGIRQGPSRALLRDVHRRAAARRRRRRHVRPRIRPLRRHLRRVLHPRLRLHPHGRHLPGQHPAVRLPRRDRNRCRRPLADGPGRPRDDAGRARLHGPVPQRRHQHRAAGGRDGRPRRHRLHAHDPRRVPGAVRAGRGTSRPAGPKSSGPAPATG